MAHILIIEPDVRLAGSYAAALLASGHSVVCRTTAQDGIIAADVAAPDLVILELQLVAHGGIEFLYEFRSYADWRAVPVIVASHVPPAELAGSSELLESGLGVRRFLYKPYMTLEQLVSAAVAVLAPAGQGTAA